MNSEYLQIPDELRLNYLKNKMTEIGIIRSQFDGKDFSLMVKLGHQMRGNADSFSFAKMSPVANQLELAAQNKNAVLVTKLLKQLEQLIQIYFEDFQT